MKRHTRAMAMSLLVLFLPVAVSALELRLESSKREYKRGDSVVVRVQVASARCESIVLPEARLLARSFQLSNGRRPRT
jgi:hypothetical protein